MIRSWGKRLIGIGLTDACSPRDSRRQRLVNLVSLFLFLITLGFSAIAIAGIRLKFGRYGLGVALGFLIPILLNHYGKAVIARGFLVTYYSAVLYLFTHFAGRELHIHFGALGVLGLGFLIFDRNPRTIIFKSLPALGVYPFGEFLVADYGFIVFIPEQAVAFRFLLELTVGFIVCLQIYYLRSTAEDFEEDLKDAVARNSQLLKIVCHDIANPLTVILADSDRDLTSPRSEQERLDRIFRNTQRLVTFLTTVRGIQREQDQGRATAPLHTGIVRIEEAIFDAIEIYRGKLENKNISVKVEGSALADSVFANRDILISSIFGNAISNAIKFTPKGGRLLVTADS
ncbi:MAG: hypothetical protein AAB425_13715, partial [Bdellovibrionota bacterium]